MDKKLILNIGNIEILSKKSSESSSFEDIKKELDYFPKVLALFQNIDIERLKVANNEFKIIFDENNLYLDNKYMNISSKVDITSKQIIFELYSLYLKDVDVLLDGKIKVDYFNEKLDYFGNVYYKDMQSSLTLDMDKKLAKFYLESKPFKNLHFLKQYLSLPKVAEEWMYDNVEGDMVLKDFYGEFDLQKNEIIEKSLKGNAQILGAKIRFNPKVDQVFTKSVDVSFSNDTLHFNIIEPIYKGKDINGSYVTIHNLSKENGVVDVYLQTNSKLDEDILDILKAYDINIPVLQKSGNTQAKLLLKFPYQENIPMTTKGEFLVNDAQISINKFEFDSKNATVTLDDNVVGIKNADFQYKDMINAKVNIDLNTSNLKANGDVVINSLLIKDDKNQIVNITNKNSPIELDFNKNVNINLADIETNIKVSDLIYVDIKNLSKIYPYSKLLNDISIKDGNISLAIKDNKNIKFNAKVKGLSLPIQKEGKNVDELELNGDISGKNIVVSTPNSDLKIEIKDNIKLFLDGYDIFVDSKKHKNSFSQPLNVALKNSNLKVDDATYELKDANIYIKKDQIDFDVIVKNLNLPFSKNGKKIEELPISGSVKNDVTKISSKKKDLVIELKGDTIKIDVDGYDLNYNTEDKHESLKSIDINGKNSNIIMNDKFKFLGDKYEIRFRDNSKYMHLNYKKSEVTFKESADKKVDIFTDNLTNEFVNAIIDKQLLKDGTIIFMASGTLDSLNGKILIENSNVDDLAILNNLLIFVQTSPALINPFLAVPSVVGMATNSGFNLTAYKIVNGVIEFNYNYDQNIVDIKKFVTVGNGIDFDGVGQINMNDNTIQSKIKLIFLKDYSKIVGAIPVVNYVLMGNDNRVETEVNLHGALENPEITTNLTKESFSVPVNIAKRVLSSPSMLFDFIKGKKEEENKKDEKIINKPLN